jgi:hypothetical protein
MNRRTVNVGRRSAGSTRQQVTSGRAESAFRPYTSRVGGNPALSKNASFGGRAQWSQEKTVSTRGGKYGVESTMKLANSTIYLGLRPCQNGP